jgi:hypothetical protein
VVASSSVWRALAAVDALPQRRLLMFEVGALRGQLRQIAVEGDELGGQQTRPGVAGLGLDVLGGAGDLGLPAQRLELAAQLAGQVAHPLQVRLHRLQLAHGALLAAAVLEDAGGLLDEPAAFLGRGPQHLVELALPDDDVHLTAEPGVAQQLLDVEEPARLPLIAYSLPPLRNRVREIVTSVYSMGSVPSVLSMVSSTWARPSGPRWAVPTKMTSSILPPRRVLAPCSPITQASASTMFDLPEPFGPTTAVTPGSNSKVVVCANDLNP